MMNKIDEKKNIERCNWCGHSLKIVWVHGHGQCLTCGINVDECCRGENNCNFQNTNRVKKNFIIVS
ncbi:MAG: hypothetical protein K8F60_07105 [Melioribacteraceae bacterium]|nr:hypothetical protein [Ignavibacteriota bacterium]MBZ0182208.1 hypothetical protein [Melioribacteraceae bacterium]